MVFDIDNLICSLCNKYLDEPKVLPCGESVCSKCLPESGNFVCLVCSACHSVTENGLPTNKTLSKILEEIKKSERLEDKILDFNVNIQEIENKLNELKLKKIQMEVEVIENCNSIINEIDLAAEDKINQINNIREDLIKEVKEYQDKCLTKFSKNYTELSDEVNLLRKDIDLILARKNFDEKLDKCYYIKSEVELSLMKIENLSLDNRKIQFDSCESDLGKDFLGTISFKNLKKKNLNDLAKPFETDFLNRIIISGSVKLNKLENENYLFSYIEINKDYQPALKQNHHGTMRNEEQKNETYTFNIVNFTSIDILEIPIENKLLDFNVYTFGNFVFLMYDQLKYISKYDSNLILLKTVNLSEPASLMLPTKKFVLVYFNGSIFFHHQNCSFFLNFFSYYKITLVR